MLNRELAEGDYSTHSMIALYPDAGLAATLAVDGGLEAGDLHCTVVYTGRTDVVDAVALRAAAEAVMRRAPIEATISGVARFSGVDGDMDVIVALVDSPALDVLRRDTLDALAKEGIDPPLNHGYTAHVTLAYVEPDDPGPWHEGIMRLEPVPITFTAIAAKHGDVRTEYVFDPPAGLTTAEAAMAAYATGFAASGGPMTDRVRAGARAAVALAETEPDRPGVMEATLRLGHLEGTWAAIFDRRDRLHAEKWAALLAVWVKLVDELDLDELAGDAEDAAAGYEDSPETRTALVLLIAGYVLAALRSLTGLPRWEDLRRIVRDAIAAADAEGAVDAAALAADKAGRVGFDFDAAHADALTLTADREDLAAAGDTMLHAALAALATAAARRLVRGFFAGDTTAQLTAGVTDTLTAAAALRTEFVHAVDRGLAASMWRLYQLGGLARINLVTVGDGHVCEPCLDAEDKGPYDLFDAPGVPLHYGCRCVLDAEGTLPEVVFDAYVIAA